MKSEVGSMTEGVASRSQQDQQIKAPFKGAFLLVRFFE
jgi:hypothetical protein